MTTVPLKEPLRTQAALYHNNVWLCNVKCNLSPESAPERGIAQVPQDVDWLSIAPLTLALHSGRRYQIVPGRLDGAVGKPQLMTFAIKA